MVDPEAALLLVAARKLKQSYMMAELIMMFLSSDRIGCDVLSLQIITIKHAGVKNVSAYANQHVQM